MSLVGVEVSSLVFVLVVDFNSNLDRSILVDEGVTKSPDDEVDICVGRDLVVVPDFELFILKFIV